MRVKTARTQSTEKNLSFLNDRLLEWIEFVKEMHGNIMQLDANYRMLEGDRDELLARVEALEAKQ